MKRAAHAENREQPLLSEFDFDAGKILQSFRSISTLPLNTQHYLETPKWLRTLRNGGPKGPPLQLADAVVPGPERFAGVAEIYFRPLSNIFQ